MNENKEENRDLSNKKQLSILLVALVVLAAIITVFFIVEPHYVRQSQLTEVIDIMKDGFGSITNRLDKQKYEQDSINKSEREIFEHLPRIFPVDKKGYQKISSNYDWRVERNGDTIFHRAIDIAAPRGTEILASAAGIVIEAKYRNGNGNYTAIDSGNGIIVTYSHQEKILVKVGEAVEQGQAIGTVGNTGYSFGYHLHIEEFWNGTKVKPGAYWS